MDTTTRPLTTDSFLLLSQTAQQIAETRDVDEKRSICLRYFQKLRNEESLELAIHFFSDSKNNKRASVSNKILTQSACDFLGIDYENVFKPCRSACGSTSETIGKLLENLYSTQNKKHLLSLEEISGTLEKIKSASGPKEKEKTLIYVFSYATGLEVKYFIRLLLYGSLRTGIDARNVTSAIAEVFDVDFEQFRYASTISGSISEAAHLARNDQLGDAEFKLFHPVEFMLASRTDNINIDNLRDYIAEENLDGMRCQVHANGNKVKLFSRNLNDINLSFPEVTRFLASCSLPKAVFDGTLCAFDNDRIMPIKTLKGPDTNISDDHPVLFVAYDIMYCGNEPVLKWPAFKRREKLEELCRLHKIPFSNQFPIKNIEDLESYLRRSINRGNDGLILKKRDSAYEYGNRGDSWLKVKDSGGKFNTVLLYAHTTDGNRDIYTEFTLGVSVDDDERYEERFIPICKIDRGQIAVESGKLNERINALIIDKYGPTLALQPEIIIEVEFDEIRMNRRTKANYILHRPRFKTFRHDLQFHNIATLRDVEHLYQEKTERKRETQGRDPSFIRC